MNPWMIGGEVAIVTAAAGVTALGAVNPRAQIFGPTVCRTNRPEKLAITFDDGPNPAITPKLLELLARHDAKATFFLVGKYVRESPSLVKETLQAGHLLGNHTDTHPNLFFRSPSSIREELESANGAIAEAVGAPPRWFRPPFGMRNPWVIPAVRQLGMQAVMWTLIPGDWRAPSAEWLMARMQPIADRAAQANFQRGRGEILCLHDGYHAQQNGDRRHTVAALAHWLPRWRDLGLEFVTIDEAITP